MIKPENVQTDVNGVWFNGKHSWRDFGMFLAERPDTGVPAPKIVTVDVPGSNGVLDYSEAAAGYIKYENRQMMLTFSAMVDAEDQEKFKANVRNALHGRQVEVELDEDSGWIYNGRATVAFENLEDWKLRIVVSVDAYPYKLSKKFRTVQLNLPALSPPAGADGVSWELKPEPAAYGINKTIFKLTRSYYTPHMPYPNNTLDVASFGGITAEWVADKTPYDTATITLTDEFGAESSVSFNATTGSCVWFSLQSIFLSVNLSKITQIVIDGIPNCKVFLSEYGTGKLGKHAKTVIDVGDMPLVPIVHQNSGQGFHIWCNSTTMFTVIEESVPDYALIPVSYPSMPNLVLFPGQNEVVVAWRLPNSESGTTEGKFCELIFREGRL